MYYIRLVIACAAMLLSWLCLGGANMPAQEPEQQRSAAETAEAVEQLYEQIPAETMEAVMEVVARETVFAPMAARSLDEMPLRLSEDSIGIYMPAEQAEDTEAVDPSIALNGQMRSECVMEQEVVMYREQAERFRLEEKQRRFEEEKRIKEEERRRIAEEEAAREAEQRRIAAEKAAREAEQRRIAAEKAAKEAALKAACPGYDAEFIATLTKEEQAEARYFYEQGFVFYRQNWSVLDDMEYGNEGFGLCGCGPTCIAAVISNLAGVPVDPEEMRVYGLSVGSWLPSGGTTYGFLIETAKKYGIKTSQIYASDKESLFAALRDENKLVLATMGPGDFTLGAHFMLFRGITDEGKILIADSYSYEYSIMEWDYEYLYAQLKNGYWIFEKEN